MNEPRTALHHAERRIGLAFGTVALAAPALAWLPPETPSTRLVTYAVLCSIGAVCLAGIAWRLHRHSAIGFAAMLYVLAVMLLRHSEGGAESGYGFLLLLPIFWAALFTGTRILTLTLVAVPLALAAPIVVFGDPAYPDSEWRRVAIWTVVAPVVATTTHRLVRSERSAHLEAATLARRDSLTGLLNRHGLKEAAEREFRHRRRTSDPLTVAVLDLDRFKRYNDTHGHIAGDRLLQRAANAWQAALREDDVIARWGGEEFVILLSDASPDTALSALDRVRRATPLGQTCSVGATRWRPGESLESAVDRADGALYEAKTLGRDRVAIVSPRPTVDIPLEEPRRVRS